MKSNMDGKYWIILHNVPHKIYPFSRLMLFNTYLSAIYKIFLIFQNNAICVNI